MSLYAFKALNVFPLHDSTDFLECFDANIVIIFYVFPKNISSWIWKQHLKKKNIMCIFSKYNLLRGYVITYIKQQSASVNQK